MSDLWYEENLAAHRAIVDAMTRMREPGEPEGGWPIFFMFNEPAIVICWGDYRSYVVLPRGGPECELT